MFPWSLLKPCQREIESRVAEACVIRHWPQPDLRAAYAMLGLLTEYNPLAAV
jgi:hypothetical protein